MQISQVNPKAYETPYPGDLVQLDTLHTEALYLINRKSISHTEALYLINRKSRPEAILGQKDLRHPIYHSDNSDRLVAMATTATQKMAS